LISDDGKVAEIEPDAGPAPPGDEDAAAQLDDELAFGGEDAFFRNEANPDREEEPDICDEVAFFRNEATADREEEPDICDDVTFFRNEATRDGEAERAEIGRAMEEFLPAPPERARKRKAERKDGLAAGQSAERKKRAPALDPLDQASAPAVQKVPAPPASGVPIKPGTGSPRGP
jgi:hypothetical protein